MGAGAFSSLAEAAGLLAPGRVVEPRLDEVERRSRYERWRTFVQGAAQFA